MSNLSTYEPGSTGITLALLDPAKGHPIQTWKFQTAPVIRIGRSDSNEVVVGDPLVSRVHAELRLQETTWKVVSVGRHGTLVDGRPVNGEAPVPNKGVIQLGPNGPALEFHHGILMGETSLTITNLNVASLALLKVDEERKRAEVDKITETDLFKNLQKQAAAMKTLPPP